MPVISVTAFALLAWLALPANASGPTTIRVSVSSSGQQGNGDSDGISISDDGRFVAFDSIASNLAPGDNNGAYDVFLRDRTTGTTTRVSVSTRGTQGNCDSFIGGISDDGRYVAYASCADNLVPHDRNGAFDVFLRDAVAGTTKLISVSSTGRQGDGDSFADSISGNGRYVGFTSFTDNLVPGDTNDTPDVFVRDTLTGTTSRISVASDGTQADCDAFGFSGSTTDDGRYVVFESCADNLVPGDTNGRTDVFMRDTVANTTTRLSVTADGTQGNDDSYAATMSGDGSTVAFTSNATNLAPAANANGHKADLFVVTLATGAIRVVSTNDDFHLGNRDSEASKALSDDGRYVVFRSFANNLVKGDTNNTSDVFLTDLVNGGTIRASVSTTGAQGNDQSANATISGDGRFVGFEAFANNLVPGDTNGADDVFVRGPMF